MFKVDCVLEVEEPGVGAVVGEGEDFREWKWECGEVLEDRSKIALCGHPEGVSTSDGTEEDGETDFAGFDVVLGKGDEGPYYDC